MSYKVEKILLMVMCGLVLMMCGAYLGVREYKGACERMSNATGTVRWLECE